MNIVGIDTSTKNLVIAVVKDGELTHATNFFSQRDHAKVILGLFEKALQASDLSLQDVDRIVCGVGPGSFTGLRVGHAFVRGLVKAEDEKIIPISSFEWIAYQVIGDAECVLVVQDAKREELFLSLLKRVKDHFEVVISDGVFSFDEAEKITQEYSNLMVTGSGLNRFQNQFKAWGLQESQFAPEEKWVPKAEDFLSLIQTKDLNKPTVSRELLPNYLRLSDAEENLGVGT